MINKTLKLTCKCYDEDEHEFLLKSTVSEEYEERYGKEPDYVFCEWGESSVEVTALCDKDFV